jgi:hypothetical protein
VLDNYEDNQQEQIRMHINKLARKMRLEGMLSDQKSRRFFTAFSNEDKLFVAFPGSHTLGDFIADIHLVKTDVLEGVGMHTGFYQRFVETGFVDEMARLVTKEPRTKQICSTGHSLGAAVATIFLCTARAGQQDTARGAPACSVRHLGWMQQLYHFQYRWIYGMSLLKRYECIGFYPLDRQFLSAGETHILP